MSEARSRVLDAGLDLLFERGVRPGVGHVKLAEAAERAGYSTSAAYRAWDGQDDFHRDLAVAALVFRDRSSIADTTAQVRGVVDEHAPWAEMLRVGANGNVHRRPDDAWFWVPLALRAAAEHDPAVLEGAKQRVADGLAAHVELYAALFAHYGREVVPPFTIEHVTMVIAALADGFAVQDVSGEDHPHLDRPDVGEGVGRDWTLFACVLEILSDAMTRPVA